MAQGPKGAQREGHPALVLWLRALPTHCSAQTKQGHLGTWTLSLQEQRWLQHHPSLPSLKSSHWDRRRGGEPAAVGHG